MTKDEINALLGYLEFNLVAMVESVETKLDGQADPTCISVLYDEAYEVLNEMERTLMDTVGDVPLTKKKLTKK